ncbi:hypothetical protein Sjap_007340 [Stephania japonica]|uniref:Uncharacterized protein n=1 Tax=Stephania japonica TaxID=461633 RepID=A0AAP0JMF6_9MAGN
MLLILRNESIKPMDTQKNMISRFFRRGNSDYILFDLMVFIIDKLFLDFQGRWDEVIVSVKAAVSHANSPLYGDEEVVGALFRGGAKFWLPEEPSTAQLSWDCHKVVDKEVIGEGFKDSENELKNSGSSSSSSHSLQERNQQLFLPRKVEILGKASQEGSRQGGFPSIVIEGIANIVLWILKRDNNFDPPIDKRVEIEKVLDPVTDHVFQQLLDIAQSITDYSTTTTTTTTHPCIFEFHNDQPLATMENIVAYNLLIRLFEDGPWSHPPPQIVCRKKAYEMVLILNNQSVVKPMDSQQEMIDNLLDALSGHIFDDLSVVVISKLYPGFVRRWDEVAFSVQPAKFSFGSWSSSLTIVEDDTIEGDEDQKVMDTLLVFTWWSIASLKTWDDEESVFKESENLLGSHALASAPRDLPNHHRSLFSSRKGGGNRC